MKYLLLLLCMFAVATPSYAVAWIGPYTVSTIEIGDGVTYFAATSTLSNPEGCTSPGFIVFDAADALMNRVIAAGLAAKASGGQVRFLISGCLTGYIHAVRIEID